MFPRSAIRRIGLLSLLAVACGGSGIDTPATAETGSGSGARQGSGTPTLDDALRSERIREDLVAHEIRPDTWVIVHERPLPANSLVVRSAEGDVLLVDTPWTPDATSALLDWIDGTLDPASKQAVNSHYHLDALGGNAALRAAGVGARGLLTTAALLQEHGEALRQGVAEMVEEPELRRIFETMEILPPPSRYQASRYGLPFGASERYVLIFPGHAHSPDNLVVHFPERKLLFGGCMVKGGDDLGYLGDADVTTWPAAIRQLLALDLEIVVAGHGKRLDPGQLENTLGLLEEVASPRSPDPGPGED